MDPQASPSGQPTDAELSALVRAGDREAFAVLWRRHADSAFIVARQYRGIADPQDIVQEASRRVLNAILGGGGPFGDFRPYMNQTVRNVAVSWSREHSPDPVGDIADYAEQAIGSGSDYADGTLERMITVRAFKSLPKRWQTVLWYTYVEGMGSDEAADHLGLSRNAAASLVGRAREGLRQAWLKAHVADDALPVECRWAVDMLPSLERNDITDRQRQRVENHLKGCARCSIIAAEINDLAAQLPILLLPLLVAGFDVLTANVEDLLAYDPTKTVVTSSPPSAAHTPLPRPTDLKPTPIRNGMTPGRIWLLSGVLAGTVAAGVIVANLWPDEPPGRPTSDLAGQAALGPSADSVDETDEVLSPGRAPTGDASPSAEPSPTPTRENVPDSTPPPTLPDAVNPGGGPEAAPVEPVQVAPVPTPTITGAPAAGAITWLGAGFTFSGTGEPGATIELVDGGTVFATTTVDADGTWTVAPSVALTAPKTSMAVGVRQLATDGRRSAATTPVDYTFVVPALGGTAAGVGYAVTGVTGTPGSVVSASLDGGAGVPQTLDGSGRTTFTFTGLAQGRHVVMVSYVSGGLTSAAITYTPTVS